MAISVDNLAKSRSASVTFQILSVFIIISACVGIYFASMFGIFRAVFFESLDKVDATSAVRLKQTDHRP